MSPPGTAGTTQYGLNPNETNPPPDDKKKGRGRGRPRKTEALAKVNTKVDQFFRRKVPTGPPGEVAPQPIVVATGDMPEVAAGASLEDSTLAMHVDSPVVG
jgi:hypothetical protein